MDLEHAFRALTGNDAPMSWQRRLYAERFLEGDIPSAVDVPTGLGKTSVMALWLIARACASGEARARLPLRLIYVVDRRVVVDQATAEAEKLRAALAGEAAHFNAIGERLGQRARAGAETAAAALREALRLDRGAALPISTLRGAHVDNRDWLADPAAPAIIVGTVDMIGSRLLFQGYGVSRSMRPYQAGLVGVDTLVVLDEAHLVPPFERLLRAVETGSGEGDGTLGPRSAAERRILPRFALLPLSATQREAQAASDTRAVERGRRAFRFDPSNGDLDDEVAERRFASHKTLRIEPMGKDHDQQLAEKALELATRDGPARVVVFCDRRSKTRDGPSAEGVADEIEKLAKGDAKSGRPARDIHPPERLVGARRVRERAKAHEELARLGFIGDKRPLDKPALLVATAAGEVGVDIDAHHMVSDLAPWERMVQRLGRVNRRGESAAEVVVFDTSPLEAKKSAPRGERLARTRELLGELERSDGASVSPAALRALSETKGADAIRAASSPEPLRPALTRAVVDAWAMTSLDEHTGRPEVGPWLRGWAEDDQPQTTLVWRRHLPVRLDKDGRPTVPAPKKDVEAFFAAAPPHESEKLETETRRVVDWLEKRARAIRDARRKDGGVSGVPLTDGAPSVEVGSEDDAAPGSEAPAADGRGRVEIASRDVVALALTPARKLAEAYGLRDFLDDPKDKRRKLDKTALGRDLAGKTLVVDARIAGLSAAGMLDAEAAGPVLAADAAEPAAWGLDGDRKPLVTFRVGIDEGGGRAEDDAWRRRTALTLRSSSDDDEADGPRLVVEKWRGAAEGEDDRSVRPRPQTLSDHQACAACKAEEIADRVGLDGRARDVLVLAARLHDEGKRAKRWQEAFKAARDAKALGVEEPLAKTRGPIDQRVLGGYRHELGSLAVFEEGRKWSAELPADIRERIDRVEGEDWKDLLLHLVAAHHGGARPVIGTDGAAEEDGPPTLLASRARDVALRFARLQRRWGPWGLAWWEALLRAADAKASRENDARGAQGAAARIAEAGTTPALAAKEAR